MRKSILSIMLFFSLGLYAQERSFWTPVSEQSFNKDLFSNRKRPLAFSLFRLDEGGLKQALTAVPSERITVVASSPVVISIPTAGGKLEQFRLVSSPVMEAGLAEKYPGIESYTGISTVEKGIVLRFAFSQRGFNGTLYFPDRPTVYISQVDPVTQTYVVVDRMNVEFDNNFNCLVEDIQKLPRPGAALRNADDGRLRTMRIAMAASGEFSVDYITGSEANDAERISNVLAKLNELLTRCNGIFEKDFGLRLLMIANNDAVVYLNAATDPWNGGDINNESQAGMNAALADGDYDIGHSLLGTGGGGDAGCIGCVCVNGSKGRGYTNLGNWNDDALVVDYLPHEIGHQLGGNHTFSHAEEGGSPAQKEPGSGTTIMSYAGITGAATDVASHSHDNFHAVSIQQITDNLESKGCPVLVTTGNAVPSANAGTDYTIPHSTPFMLTGSGSDADGGDVLNYVWEQYDGATFFPTVPSTTATSGPAFRNFSPTAGVSRIFPSLPFILNGSNTQQWERLPSVGRTLNFRFTVRDNHPGGGQNRSDDMVVTVDGGTGPFAVTSPNTATTWCPGNQTVTWSVAGTDGGAVNTSHVNILLSLDGGSNFSPLLMNTPNDGSANVTIACQRSTQARIMVQGAGNIFFDISNANFTIGDNTPPTFTDPPDMLIFKDASCNFDASIGVTGDVTDESDNCSSGIEATFTDESAAGTCEGETIIIRTWRLVDNCNNATEKLQRITIRDNTPPTFTAPPAAVIYADASCSYDASPAITGDVTDEADNCDPSLDAIYSDLVVDGSCAGEKIITRTWSLSDDCGNLTQHTQTITVLDTLPPVISGISATPNSLWPPNHKMRNVVISYTASDNCSAVNTYLTVSSNEAVNGNGDGNTAPDWEIVNNHLVKLRAERSGNGNGRIYTITIVATDDCGNTSQSVVLVTVAHDNSFTISTPSSIQGLALRARPNPSPSTFAVSVEGAENEGMLLQVINAAGIIIETRKVFTGSTYLMGENYRPGVYIFRLQQGNGQRTLKLIKLPD